MSLPEQFFHTLVNPNIALVLLSIVLLAVLLIISVDFLIFWRVVDPVASVVQVQNFAGASQGIATTTLRAVIGDIMLDDVLAQREHINTVLRTKLDEVTERWSNKVTAVEIREILPPNEIQSSMTR